MRGLCILSYKLFAQIRDWLYIHQVRVEPIRLMPVSDLREPLLRDSVSLAKRVVNFRIGLRYAMPRTLVKSAVSCPISMG
jgi:hypothetical protein